MVFEKLVQVVEFGCAYHRIADEKCSATTLRRRRDEWIEAGAMDALQRIVKETYDRIIGLELSDVAVDCCITKLEGAKRPPWGLDRARLQPAAQHSVASGCDLQRGYYLRNFVCNRGTPPALFSYVGSGGLGRCAT
jgi:hypothetical protein